MNLISKRRKPFLYAQRSPKDSVGPCLGTLPAGRIGRVQCWEAVGDARREFTKELKIKIINYLEQNNDKVQDSGNIIDLSLFMLGRSTTQAKPTVMFVSEDKKARKEAFNMIKDSNILKAYPGFELGHIPLTAEFENLKFLALTDASLSSRLEGRRLFFYPKTGSEETPQTATAGGVVSYQGKRMLLTVNHFLEPTQPSVTHSFMPSSEEDDDSDDEREITGLGDFDDEDEDHLIEITSQGSITPDFEISDVDGSRSGNDERSGISSESTMDVPNNITTIQERLERLEQNQPTTHPVGAMKQQCTQAGKVILRSQELDYSLIEIDHSLMGLDDLDNTIELGDVSQIEPGCRDAAVKATTPEGGIVGGALSGTPSYVRLPQSKAYVEVYLARFNRPLVPGDCGSWVRDAVTGRPFGHVFAGSPTSGLTMIMPAHHVFDDARKGLESQSRGRETKPVREVAGEVEKERDRDQGTQCQPTSSEIASEKAIRDGQKFIHKFTRNLTATIDAENSQGLTLTPSLPKAEPPSYIIDPTWFWRTAAWLSSRKLHHLHTRGPNSSDWVQGHQCHRDLSPENILWFSKPSDRVNGNHLSITDFGRAYPRAGWRDKDILDIDSHGGQTYGELLRGGLRAPHNLLMPAGSLPGNVYGDIQLRNIFHEWEKSLLDVRVKLAYIGAAEGAGIYPSPGCSANPSGRISSVNSQYGIWPLDAVYGRALIWSFNGIRGRGDYSSKRKKEISKQENPLGGGFGACFLDQIEKSRWPTLEPRRPMDARPPNMSDFILNYMWTDLGARSVAQQPKPPAPPMGIYWKGPSSRTKEDRDHIILVDDFGSIKLHMDKVGKAARVVSFLANDYGIDLSFPSNSIDPLKYSWSTAIGLEIQKTQTVEGMRNTRNCLSDLQMAGRDDTGVVKSTSIFVFVDGTWRGHRADDVIEHNLRRLIEAQAPSSALMFQFILGADPLLHLDDEYIEVHELGECDVLDTKHCDPHVLGIVIGVPSNEIWEMGYNTWSEATLRVNRTEERASRMPRNRYGKNGGVWW
ncbi:hypothetical protein CEP54_015698 [Fusarium duplospermum]|uniref:Protein kinase domain-containing protein n=1 Tax=Fusarium duplospermum TaxID=1325734 RepID=A0A428NM39_9HYPO|nr:hypothetical protein CEP54_015698 [Fusarium duplospermum]